MKDHKEQKDVTLPQDTKGHEPTKLEQVKEKKADGNVLRIFLILLMGAVVLYVIFFPRTLFQYEKHWQDTAFIVDGEEVPLKEAGYYILQVERQGNVAALEYNPKNPSEYWGAYMNQGEETSYVTDLGKQAVMDYMLRDLIYAREAKQQGVVLSEEEQQGLLEESSYYYAQMTDRERAVTGLTEEELYDLMCRERLAHKYMLQLAQQHPEGVYEAIILYYDVGGSAYEALKAEYEIHSSDALWEKLKIGHITIN